MKKVEGEESDGPKHMLLDLVGEVLRIDAWILWGGGHH